MIRIGFYSAGRLDKSGFISTFIQSSNSPDKSAALLSAAEYWDGFSGAAKVGVQNGDGNKVLVGVKVWVDVGVNVESVRQLAEESDDLGLDFGVRETSGPGVGADPQAVTNANTAVNANMWPNGPRLFTVFKIAEERLR